MKSIKNIIIKHYRKMYTQIYKFTNYSFFLKRVVYIIRKIQDNIQYFFLNAEVIEIDKIIKISNEEIKNIIKNNNFDKDWSNALSKLNKLGISKKSGGITEVDQEILYKLIKGYNRKNILEIGTHIGSSTVVIALSLNGENDKNFDTVDVNDVNDRREKIWIKFNSKHSPRENLRKLNSLKYTKFIVSDSKKYMNKTKSKYDLIFLDGNHRTASTYNEIRLSMSLLKQGGIIILHDYINNKNLFGIAGPFLAMKKLISVNPKLRVKLFKNSSLALIHKI